MFSSRLRTITIVLAVSCAVGTASTLPAVSQADTKGGTTTVTCEGGAKPGDVDVITITTVRNGKLLQTGTQKEVCGKDGKWHPVASIVVSGSTLSPALAGLPVKPAA